MIEQIKQWVEDNKSLEMDFNEEMVCADDLLAYLSENYQDEPFKSLALFARDNANLKSDNIRLQGQLNVALNKLGRIKLKESNNE